MAGIVLETPLPEDDGHPVPLKHATAIDECLHAPHPEHELADRRPQSLAVCGECAGQMYEMRNYREPRWRKTWFLCTACGRRWRLETLNQVKMRLLA